MNNIPKTMRAAAIDRFGGPEVLSIHTLPVPTLDEGEVLVAIHTAGVGSWDAEMREGWLPDGAPRFPLVLGTDGAGVVVAVGAGVRRFKVGEHVYGYSFNNPKGGFYAEYVAVSAEKIARVPVPLDMESAGAIGTTGLTALQGVDDALHVKEGDAILVHGAAGGVGTLAVQFAKLRRAKVLATASGKTGLALVRRLGADAVVDGRQADIMSAARQFARDGLDGVLAFVGGRALAICIDALRQGGRVAYPHGITPEPGKHLGADIVSYDAVANVRAFQQLGRAIEESKLEVPIAAAFSLAEAALAHARLAEGHVLGKVVLSLH
jgi:NADPH2:quinone reductase